MKFTLGTKEEMTSIYDEAGRVHPATAISVGPMFVLAVKSKEKDGYNALQVGFGEQKKTRLGKAIIGHIEKALGKESNGLKYIMEFPVAEEDLDKFKLGQEIIATEVFSEGDKVVVSGVSKGKGFQGVVKRHGFAGGPRSHGQKHTERSPGSIGAGGVQKVIKGLRMAGRMGSDRVTVKGLKVVKVDKENNLVYISGALPGRRGTLLEVKSL